MWGVNQNTKGLGYERGLSRSYQAILEKLWKKSRKLLVNLHSYLLLSNSKRSVGVKVIHYLSAVFAKVDHSLLLEILSYFAWFIFNFGSSVSFLFSFHFSFVSFLPFRFFFSFSFNSFLCYQSSDFLFFLCYWTKLDSACPCAVKPIYWHRVVVKESAAFFCREPSKESRELVLRIPEFPAGFQKSIFKGKVREEESQGM